MNPPNPSDSSNPEELLSQADWVRGLARRLVTDDSRADDLAQETFLAWLTRPPQTGERLRGWLATVTRYRARSEHRRETRQRAREAAAARPEALPTDEDVLDRAELHRNLVGAVFALEEPYRTTVLLRYFEGMDTDAVAKQQGIERATVRSRLKRGIERLRRELDETCGGRSTWMVAMAGLAEAPWASAGVAGDSGTSSSLSSSSSTPASSSAASPTWVVPKAGVALSGLTVGGILMSIKSLVVATVAAVAIVGAVFYFAPDEKGAPGAQSGATNETARVESDDTVRRSDSIGETRGPALADTAETVVASDPLAIPPVASAYGSIEGTVTDAEGHPLSEIVLHAVIAPRAPELDIGFEIDMPVTIPAKDDPKYRAVSDVDGRFTVAQLPPGRYALVAQGAGYRTETVKDLEVERDVATTVTTQLQPGLSISGVVRTPLGRPAPFATVTARRGLVTMEAGGGRMISVSFDTHVVGGRAGRSPGDLETQADEQGRFVIDGLSEGAYELRGQHAEWAGATLDSVAAGSEGVELELERGGSIVGVVQLPSGMAAEGAMVTASPRAAGGMPGMRMGRAQARSANTDENGRFVLEGVSPGSTALEVSLDGFPTLEGSRVEVQAGRTVKDVTLMLVRGADIRGRVLDPEGEPVAGARVELSSGSRWMGAMSVDEAVTDADGNYAFRAQRIGDELRLVAKHDAYVESGEELVVIERDLALPDLQLLPAASVRGRVVDGAGNGVAGAEVSLRKVRRDDEGAFTTRIIEEALGSRGARAITDENGEFVVTPVAEGGYTLRVAADGYPKYEGVEFFVDEGAEFDHAIVRLQEGRSILGVVVDANGEPLVGAEVRATKANSSRVMMIGGMGMGGAGPRATTDRNGRFVIEGLEDVRYELFAQKEGMAPLRRGGVTPGPDEVRLTLAAQGGVRGWVTDAATGAPVTSFSVGRGGRGLPGLDPEALLRSGGVGPVEHPDGEFTLDGLDPGTHELTFKADGYVKQAVTVDVPSGDVVEVTVTLENGGALEGVVVDAQGKPVAGARVTEGNGESGDSTIAVMIVADDSGEETSTVTLGEGGVTTDADGRFLLTGLAPGKVDLTISHRAFRKATIQDALVVRNETRSVPRTVLTRGATIRGVVYDAEGIPTRHANVLIWSLDEEGRRTGMPKFAPVAANGEYSRGGLTAGSYQVEAQRWSMSGDDEEVDVVVGGGGGADGEAPAVSVEVAEGETQVVDLRPE